MHFKNISDLIYFINLQGCEIIDQGETVSITNWSKLTSEIQSTIKANKSEIINTVKRDKLAKSYGYIIAIAGEIYTKSINNYSAIYIQCVDGFWVASKENHLLNGNSLYKEITKDYDLRIVFPKANDYLNYFRR
ncbi:hypothetical protein [Bacillus sp. AFS017336]|uniref:hypothetical protein n=1 Tax=Bacillus sp. AFS017336 TaxID=2033489 RepID=UPI001155A22B|nr:hypothetical protein [Bacillus sp. AFS017336]